MALSNEQAKEALVKLTLKEYFFSSPDVAGKFPLPDNIQNKNIDIESYKTISEAREAAFEGFFNRLKYGTILNSEGAAYPKQINMIDGQMPALPNDMTAIANDLLAGKGIYFLGAGGDGMVNVKAEPKSLNYTQVHMNRTGKIPAKLSSWELTDGTGPVTVKENSDPRTEIEALSKANMEEPMPKRGGFWNKVCKKLLGRPSARWTNYENAQRRKNCTNAIANAGTEKDLSNELSDENVQNAYNKAYNKVKGNQSLGKGNVNIGDITQTIMDNFVYDKDSKTFETKAAYERKHGVKAPVQSVNIKVQEGKTEIKEDDGLIRIDNIQEVKLNPAPKKTKVEIPQPKEIGDPHKPQRDKSVEAILKHVAADTKNRGKIETFGKHLEISSFGYDFKEAVEALQEFCDPNVESNLTKEQIADHLATLYIGGELTNCLKNGKLENNNTTKYGVIVEDLNSDEPDIQNKIRDAAKEMFLKKGLAQKFLDQPNLIDKSIFDKDGKGFDEFIKATSDHLDNMIGKIAENNKNLNKEAKGPNGPMQGW